jgi:transcriptional regulator with XRE-family HTH domain
MKLYEWRKKENKTQQEVADALGVFQSVIQKWESGETIPRPESMQKIVEYTKGEVQPNDFYNMEV